MAEVENTQSIKFKKTVVCSVINSKGGVGKTTTTFIVGHILHDLYGLNVLIVDGDGSCSLTTMCCGKDNLSNFENANLYTLITDEKCNVKDCIVTIADIDLIPSDQRLEEAERYIESKGGNVNHVIKKKLKEIIDMNFYDIILIDSKPTVTSLTRNYLVASDYIVLVYQAEYQCLLDSQSIIDAIAQVNDELAEIGLPQKKTLGCLITMTNSTNLCKEVVEAIKEALNSQNIDIFNATIPRNVKISESTTQNLPSNLYAPKSKGNKAYEEFAGELLEKLKKEGIYE